MVHCVVAFFFFFLANIFFHFHHLYTCMPITKWWGEEYEILHCYIRVEQTNGSGKAYRILYCANGYRKFKISLIYTDGDLFCFTFVNRNPSWRIKDEWKYRTKTNKVTISRYLWPNKFNLRKKNKKNTGNDSKCSNI